MDEVLDFVREERRNRQGVLDAIKNHPERRELANAILSRLDAGDLLQLSGLLAPRNKTPPYDDFLNTQACEQLLQSLTQGDRDETRGTPAPENITKWWHIYLRREEQKPNLSGIIKILQNAASIEGKYSVYEDFVILNRSPGYLQKSSLDSFFDRKELKIKTTPYTSPMKDHGVLVLRIIKKSRTSKFDFEIVPTKINEKVERYNQELVDVVGPYILVTMKMITSRNPSKPFPQLMAKRAEFNCLISLKNYKNYVDTHEEIKEFEDMIEEKYAERPEDTSSQRMGKHFHKINALRDIRNKRWIDECQGCNYYGDCECYKLKKIEKN